MSCLPQAFVRRELHVHAEAAFNSEVKTDWRQLARCDPGVRIWESFSDIATAHRVDGAGELDNHPVAGGLDDPPLEGRDGGLISSRRCIFRACRLPTSAPKSGEQPATSAASTAASRRSRQSRGPRRNELGRDVKTIKAVSKSDPVLKP